MPSPAPTITLPEVGSAPWLLMHHGLDQRWLQVFSEAQIRRWARQGKLAAVLEEHRAYCVKGWTMHDEGDLGWWMAHPHTREHVLRNHALLQRLGLL